VKEADAKVETRFVKNKKEWKMSGMGGMGGMNGGGMSGENSYVEEVVEVDVEGLLGGYEAEAREDRMVIQYAGSEMVHESRYPASFSNVTPVSVLHALYHSRYYYILHTTYIHTYIHTYTHTYIHTYIHTHIHLSIY
jgi:hypothetical protein